MKYFLEFIYYLAYQTTAKRNKEPRSGALMYMLIFLIVVFVPIYMIIEAFIEIIFDIELKLIFQEMGSLGRVSFILVFNLIILYILFIRKDLEYFDKYSNSKLLFFIKPWLLVPLPFLILLLVIIIRIILFGGFMFGTKYDGFV